MKPNVLVTIMFAIITVALFTASIVQLKKLQALKDRLTGTIATEGKPAMKSIEEEVLTPLRQDIAVVEQNLEQAVKDYYTTNREVYTLKHKVTVNQLVYNQTIYYKDKWQSESVLFTNNRKYTEEAKKTELEKYQSEIDKLNAEIARDTASYDESKQFVSDQRKALVDKIPLIEDQMNKEKNFKETQIARSRDDLRKFVLKSASTYSMAPINGEILTSNTINNTAVISLGKKDGVRRGMKFDIIRENENKDWSVKGQFRINDVTDTTAFGYIIDLVDTTNPILVGDYIGNPLFVKRKEAVLTGEIINAKLGANQILINRGASHNVKVGYQFEVYIESEATHRNVKAQCKVIEVNENTSVCTLFDIIHSNIFNGDKIGSKVDKKEVLTFFLAGSFKKKYLDKDLIKAKIESFGHRVVEELTPTTNYLVEGTEEADFLVKTARELNITVMQEDDLLRYLD